MNLTFNITQFVNDSDSIIFTYNCSSNETDVVANVLANGIVNITASNNFTNSARISCTVDDGMGGRDTASFIVDVLPRNDPLYFDGPIPDIFMLVNGTYNGLDLKPYFIDVDNEPLITYNFTPNPLTNFTILVSSNGLVNITPNQGFVGNTSTVFRATDSFGPSFSNIVRIFVTNISARSEIVNSIINGTVFNIGGPNFNGNYSSYIRTFDSDNILSSRIFRSTLVSDEYSINMSNIFDSSVINSYILNSDVRRNSIINNSILRNCVVENSLVKNYLAVDCIINNSIVDPPSGLNNLTGTNASNTTIMKSNVTYSEVNDSFIIDSDIDISTIIRCRIINSDLVGVTYTDCLIINGVIDNGTVKNSTLNGTNTTNTNIINTTLPPVNITNGVIIDGKICNGTIMQKDIGTYVHSGPCVDLRDIINYKPSARFTYSGTVDNAQTQFTSTSTDPNIGRALNDSLTYLWNFGNEQTSTLMNPSLTYGAGTYIVTLIVTDRFGKSDSTSQQIIITSSGGSGGSGGNGGGGGSGGGSGGSGGGGSGGGGGSLRPTDRTLDFGDSNGGIRLWVVEGDRFVYRIDGVDHVITFTKITPSGADITATESIPGRKNIAKTKTGYFEFNKDTNYDLGINILQSANRRARVIFTKGGGPLSAEDLALLESLRARGIPVSNGRINEIPPSRINPRSGPAGSIQLLPGEEIRPWTNWWLWLILVLIALVLLFVAFFDWIVTNVIKPFLRWILIDLFGWKKKEVEG